DYGKIGRMTGAVHTKLAQAQWFDDVRRVKSDPVLAQYFSNKPAVHGACFDNCQKFILEDESDNFAYFEGYIATATGLLVHPCWLVGNRIVFDPSFEVAAPELEARGIKAIGYTYYGLGFGHSEVL